MSLVGLRGAVISTHSAHEDGDYFQTLNTFPMSRISTHSAHEDGDQSLNRFASENVISTHSAHEDGDLYESI